MRDKQQRAAETKTESIADKLPVGTPQPAFIDVSALAKRLPSWKLAQQLEKGGQNVRFSAIDAPQAPRALQLQSAPSEKPSGSLPRPAGEIDEPMNGTGAFERAPLRVAARDAAPLENQARQRQEGTLEAFLTDVAHQQDATRADDKMSLRAELEDEIEATQRLALASLEPLLPPPAIQLEMTNLRIQLLPNSAPTEAERQQAAARLEQLEAEWRTQLRAQANQRFEELRHLLTEVPVEKRVAGYHEIQKTLSERAVRDENLRKLVESALRERIAAGFGSDDRAALFIQLPGAKLAPQTMGTAPISPAAAPFNFIDNQINSNTPLLWPSAAAFIENGGAVSSVASRSTTPLTNTQKHAATLRQQALKEAAHWAKSIARRRNWRLQSRRTSPAGQSIPDRTGEALQLLNL